MDKQDTELKIVKKPSQLKNILEFPLSLVITAKRQSGKSVLLRKMIDSIWKDYFAIYVFSPTACLSSDWDQFKTKKYSKVFEFIDEPDKEMVEDIFETMLIMKKGKIKDKKKFNEKVLLIFDDTTEMYSNHSASDIFNRLSTKGRHVNISFILTCHMWHWMPTGMRQNTLQKIFFRINNNKEMENISKECANATAEKDDIENIINEQAKDYNAIMLKETSEDTEFYLLSRNI